MTSRMRYRAIAVAPRRDGIADKASPRYSRLASPTGNECQDAVATLAEKTDLFDELKDVFHRALECLFVNSVRSDRQVTDD